MMWRHCVGLGTRGFWMPMRGCMMWRHCAGLGEWKANNTNWGRDYRDWRCHEPIIRRTMMHETSRWALAWSCWKMASKHAKGEGTYPWWLNKDKTRLYSCEKNGINATHLVVCSIPKVKFDAESAYEWFKTINSSNVHGMD
jgi:hypothetical protein